MGTVIDHTYDIKMMYYLHKDNINETIESVYRIESFLEYKVVNAVCAYDKMPQVIGSYLRPEDPITQHFLQYLRKIREYTKRYNRKI